LAQDLSMSTTIKELPGLMADRLQEYSKLNPADRMNMAEFKIGLINIIRQATITPDQATAAYKVRCLEFLNNVIKVRGLPGIAIASSGDNNSDQYISSEPVPFNRSGQYIYDHFDEIMPRIKSEYNTCIENFKRQADLYYAEQLNILDRLVSEYLNNIPKTAKERNPKISEIRKEVAVFSKWHRLFGIYKQASFSAEIRYLLIKQDNPIAAMWCYSRLDEDCETKPEFDHKSRDGLVYAVKGNWAETMKLMKPGQAGYLDDVDMPTRQLVLPVVDSPAKI